MPNTVVSLEIVEADVARTSEAAKALTGKTGTLKEQLAAVLRNVVVKWERETHPFTPPGIS